MTATVIVSSPSVPATWSAALTTRTGPVPAGVTPTETAFEAGARPSGTLTARDTVPENNAAGVNSRLSSAAFRAVAAPVAVRAAPVPPSVTPAVGDSASVPEPAGTDRVTVRLGESMSATATPGTPTAVPCGVVTG